jgi:hypothetical protein
MIRALSSVGLALLLAFGPVRSAPAAPGENSEKAPAPAPPTAKTDARPITVTGEVVDTWCYASHVMGEGRGPKHRKCALACISGGVAPGIVDDQGNLYIAAKHRGYEGCRSLLLPYVAKRVTATGWVARKGGCQVLKITSVRPAP